jgi:hypothetical protein
MSAYLKPVISAAVKLITPSFYVHTYAGIVKSTRAQVLKGSVNPLGQFILLVGVVGYAQEYIGVGRK